MRSTDFFETHPVFTAEEYAAARESMGVSHYTTRNLLTKHMASGRLVRIRRGLYATVPRGIDPARAPVDPYLLATKLGPDVVVTYHAALQFHGKVYSVWNRFHYLTRRRSRNLWFRNMEFVAVQAPTVLRTLADLGGGVVEKRHAGGVVRVTTLERTLVDVMDRPELVGGWEEIWRSLEMVEFFDLDAVVNYVRRLGPALTAARVGFFLEQHKDALMVEEQHLDALRRLAPAQPRYLDSSREHGRLVSPWNLIVPRRILERTWQEVA